MSQATASCSPLLAQARDAAIARDFARAEQLLTGLLRDEPDHLDALDLLGFVLFFLDRPAEAETACRKALALSPNRPYSTKGLGLCMAKQGRVDEGCEHLRAAIQLKPDWFDPRWDLAIVLGDAQRWQEALAVLVEAEAALPHEQARYAALRSELVNRRANLPGIDEGPDVAETR